MHNAFRTVLSLVFSIVLFSALAIAHDGGNSAEKDKNKEHYSRLSKVAFWRHHKNAKQEPIKQAHSREPQAKTARLKPASAKQKPLATKNTKAQQKTQDPKAASLKQ
jgi:hypothetical protein